MKSKYLNLVKNYWNSQYAVMLELFVKHGYIDELQTVLKREGYDIDVDGLIGLQTIITLYNLEQKIGNLNEFWDKVYKEVNKVQEEKQFPKEVKKKITLKKRFMNALHEQEGNTFHYLRGEHGFTCPYGIYSYAWKNSKPVIYGKQLFKKYGLNYKVRKDAYKLNKYLTAEEKAKTRELAWEFYLENFINKKVMAVLPNHPDSFISYTLTSINAGNNRGNKCLQRAIGAVDDGKVGNGTIAKLKQFCATHDDNDLNQGILDARAKYYIYLVTRSKNKHKFKRFSRGWCAACKKLGYKTSRQSCG